MNRYLRAGEMILGYDYDGNLISAMDPNGTTTCEYDVDNRLIQVEGPAGDTWEYIYDALGNRIRMSHAGTGKRFIYDPVGLIDVTTELTDGILTARYLHGLGLVARAGALGEKSYYGFDGVDHTRHLTDAAGNLINQYDYDPYGLSLGVTESIPNPFRYAGRFGVMKEAHGLYFMRARYYSAELGRFVVEDPIGLNVRDVNLYRYVRNRPSVAVDPSGLDDFDFIEDVLISDRDHYENVTLREATEAIQDAAEIVADSYKGEYDTDKIIDWFDDWIERSKRTRPPSWDKQDPPQENDTENDPDPDPDKDSDIDEPDDEKKLDVVDSFDPNEKVGIAGIGEQRYVVGGARNSPIPSTSKTSPQPRPELPTAGGSGQRSSTSAHWGWTTTPSMPGRWWHATSLE
ncbi:MAG: hypothetical protein GY703_01320 [Gammaproteobacteria bacterium]|nr:hypothetical protein [Gammaproteobacteria bacterium]